MHRITIEWKDLPPIISDCYKIDPIKGVVSVYDSRSDEEIGKWEIYVDSNCVSSRRSNGERSLPPCYNNHRDIVEEMAKAYYLGINHVSAVHAWRKENK